MDHLRSLCVLCTAYVRPPYGLYTAYNKLSEIGRGTLKRLHDLYGFYKFIRAVGTRSFYGSHKATILCTAFTLYMAVT